jgi:hypothetical protein
MAGAPTGNQNAARGNRWRSAIERALQKKYGRELAEAMDELALKFIDAVEKGDIAAFREFGDRIDGKPKQQIEATGPDDGPIEQKLTVEFVNAGADSKSA